MRIYDVRQKVRNEFYKDDAAVGQAMMLTSEGWAVMYAPAYVRGAHQYWESIDHQGMIHRISTSFLDPVSGLVYLKVEGDGFRGDVSFPDWDAIDIEKPILAVSVGGVAPAALESLVPTSDTEEYDLWKPRMVYTLAGDVTPGDVLIAEDGTFLGYVNEASEMIESWMVSTQLQSLFSQSKNEYRTLALRGYQVDGVVADDAFASLKGFYVSNSPTRASTSTVATGDVVVGIAGLPFDEQTAARDLLFAGDTVRMRVLRNGNIEELLVNQAPITP